MTMRWFRSRRHSHDDWIDAIKPELRDLPVPSPRDDLFARIVASRNARERIILPDVPIVAERALPPGVVALFVAVVLLLLVPFARSTIFRRHADVAPREESVASEWLAGSLAFAGTDQERRESTIEPVRFSSPERLRPVTLEYKRTWRDSPGRVTDTATGVIALRADTVDRTPSWRLVSVNAGSRHGRAFRTVDSVYVARSDLRLLRRVAIQAPYSRYDEIRIEQRFTRDSVVGRMNANGAKMPPAERRIARRLPPSPVPHIADPFAPVLFG